MKKIILFDYNDDKDDNNLCIKIINGYEGCKIHEELNVQETWSPVGNDTLYFLPGCAVPRFKVREQFTCTIKPENATAVFISRNELKGSENTFKEYQKLLKINPVKMDHWIKEANNAEQCKLLYASLRSSGIDTVYMTEILWYNKSYSKSMHKYSVRLSDHFQINRWSDKNDYKKNPLKGKIFKPIKNKSFDNLTYDIYFEDSLLSKLNKDNLIIDEIKYEELRAFGKTEDKENVILMIELMSNSDYEKSFIYLLLLLKEFGGLITPLKESKHVNFKSLLTYLKINNSLADLTIKDLTQSLKIHKRFTKSNACLVSMACVNEYVHYADPENDCWTKGPVLKKNYIT